MPKLADDRLPAYRLHKQSGQAIVTLSGRDHLLGPHGSAASRAEYNRLTAEWIAGGRQLVTPQEEITIAEIAAAFWKHAQRYYRDATGAPTGEAENYAEAMGPLRKLYARTPAVEFGPLSLKAVRGEMIRRNWARTRINRQISRVRHVFNWAAENEMIPGTVCHALATVKGLRAGKSEARESEPVRPVAEDHARAILRYVATPVAAMIELQLLTGARPGEVLTMRGCDIDTSGKLWVYRPSKHKTAHHGHAREIYIGPRAQRVLRPFLSLNPQANLFSPVVGKADRQAVRSAARATPEGQGNEVGTNRVRRPKRAPRDGYDVASYRRAIARGCDLAFPPPTPLAKEKGESAAEWRGRLTDEQLQQLRAWRRKHRWHPHQLRHTAGTNFRKEFGLEAAQVLLGHKTLTVTQVYAEKNVAAAQAVMANVG